MFGRAWRIGSIGGVDIRVDTSWAFIAVLITYSLWIRFSDFRYGLDGATPFLIALLSSVLFFGSVLIHELAHAGMARARRIPVSGITLFFFGGATSARLEDRSPSDEFLVTAVGPGSSFALAGIFWALSQAVGNPVHVALRYVAGVNLILAVFNLVPGFPLDGGRILRSLIWRATGNMERATRVASTAGMIVGVGLIVWGVIEAIATGYPPALWLAFVGWFLLQAARASLQQQRVRRALAGGVVRDVMRPPPPGIPAAMSLSESLDRYLRGHEEETFPVVEDGRVVGLLNFPAARRVGRTDPLRPVRDAMLPVTEGLTVRVDDPLDAVSDRLAGRDGMVLSDSRLVGAISGEDLARWLRGNRRS